MRGLYAPHQALTARAQAVAPSVGRTFHQGGPKRRPVKGPSRHLSDLAGALCVALVLALPLALYFATWSQTT